MSIFRVITTEGSNEPVLTVENLRGFYGFKIPTTSEAMYTRMILAAQKACASYLGVTSLKSVLTCEEIFNTADGQRLLCLSAAPVKGVTSVVGSSGIGYAFRCDTGSATVYPGTSFSGEEVCVTYTVGWGDAVPEDVLYCVAMTVQKMAKDAQSARVGEVSRTTEGGSESWEQTVVPNSVQQYLSRYRMNLAR